MTNKVDIENYIKFVTSYMKVVSLIVPILPILINIAVVPTINPGFGAVAGAVASFGCIFTIGAMFHFRDEIKYYMFSDEVSIFRKKIAKFTPIILSFIGFILIFLYYYTFNNEIPNMNARERNDLVKISNGALLLAFPSYVFGFICLNASVFYIATYEYFKEK